MTLPVAWQRHSVCVGALDGQRIRMAQSGVRRLLSHAVRNMGVYGSRWASPSSKRLHGRLRVRGWVRLPYASAPAYSRIPTLRHSLSLLPFAQPAHLSAASSCMSGM